MYSLGPDFVPAAVHAGGLRYHGMSPLVSHCYHEGLIQAISVKQLEAFEAGVMFSPGPKASSRPSESNHAIARCDSAGPARGRDRRVPGDCDRGLRLGTAGSAGLRGVPLRRHGRQLSTALLHLQPGASTTPRHAQHAPEEVIQRADSSPPRGARGARAGGPRRTASARPLTRRSDGPADGSPRRIGPDLSPSRCSPAGRRPRTEAGAPPAGGPPVNRAAPARGRPAGSSTRDTPWDSPVAGTRAAADSPAHRKAVGSRAAGTPAAAGSPADSPAADSRTGYP